MAPRFVFPRGISLRTLLVLLVLVGSVFGGVPSLYLGFQVGSPAFTLGTGTEAIVALLEDLDRRHGALDRSLDIARSLVAGTATPGAKAQMARLAALGSVRAAPQPYAQVNPALRVRLGRTDEAMSQLGNMLAEIGAMVELHRSADAHRRLLQADSVHAVVDAEMEVAASLGRAELIDRVRNLEIAAREATQDTALWLLAGAALVPLLVLVVRRRIWQPLANLEQGLTRVSDGDLTAQVPVSQVDELSKLAEHFNAMTYVLRDRAEEQGRFAAAGELLAGIAHEVNNPLMAIAAHAELRLADPGASAEQRAEMQQILRQAQRATKLLRGLLRFVRAGERLVAHVNLNEIVRAALDLVSYRFGVDEITVSGRLDQTLPPVDADGNRLEQVMVNLLSNALDALRSVRPPRVLTVDSWLEAERVHVAVQDNGPGIAPEIAERLFRPFATTKGRRGTGLGLYISRQLVREVGGDLSVTSQPGAGARFLVTMPIGTLAPTPTPEPVVPAAAATHPLAGVRVLLVDDEEPIRRPIARFLARRGAVVIEAGDGEEALERLNGEPVDVILADLRMPRLDGPGLHARLQATQPALADRMLFLSGDITQLAGRGLAPLPRERLLVKPVELSELQHRIEEFLKGMRGAGGERGGKGGETC
ncbi:MAG TPA: ATP-binding protein [Gemmatimonadales bacterium]|nr:ATP-binding protein [Gemmatimonadales bacterium]